MILRIPARFRTDIVIIALLLLAFIVLGHDGKRVLQLTGLALPVFALLAWPIRHPGLHRLRIAVAWLWTMAFALDGAARAHLLDAYASAPDSAAVLGAIANTHLREGAEYLAMHWRSAAAWSCALALAGVLFGRGMRHAPRQRPRTVPRGAAAALCVVLALAALSYAGKSWRRHHPAVFWSQWASDVAALRAGWLDQAAERSGLMRNARQALPAVAGPGPSTVVLVIGDSINRDNLSLYGYDPSTTPGLAAEKSRLGDRLLVLRNAWSVDASTLPALHNLFGFGAGPHLSQPQPQPQPAAKQHLLALARTAGYKVWWISNHDDIAIEQQHARHADVVDMVNRRPGRSGAALDGELLDELQAALDDRAERKLVVMHLMGAHPHYRLRFPADANPFDDTVDTVESRLVRKGRTAWIRRSRHEYDAALLYHDSVVAGTLQRTLRAGPDASGRRAWMYLSDHGQEVGHGRDHAGHSPHTASGYRIPAIVWRSDWATPPEHAVAPRPFRADWAGWTLADLLDLDWQGRSPERNVLDSRYRWQDPVLPFAVPSFADG